MHPLWSYDSDGDISLRKPRCYAYCLEIFAHKNLRILVVKVFYTDFYEHHNNCYNLVNHTNLQHLPGKCHSGGKNAWPLPTALVLYKFCWWYITWCKIYADVICKLIQFDALRLGVNDWYRQTLPDRHDGWEMWSWFVDPCMSRNIRKATLDPMEKFHAHTKCSTDRLHQIPHRKKIWFMFATCLFYQVSSFKTSSSTYFQKVLPYGNKALQCVTCRTPEISQNSMI